MAFSSGDKKEILESFGISSNDSGSAYVQVALLSEHIRTLTEHLKVHKKDFSSKRGLLKMISQRRSFLKYLARRDEQGYKNLVKRLGLKK